MEQESIRINHQMKQDLEQNINENLEELQKKAHKIRMETLESVSK